MKYFKRAFTLVELIVVITILSILGTIAFVSYGLYTSNARDSVRISDIENINKSLNIFNIEHGFFPEPDGPHFISYSGSIAWTQGYFGEDLLRKTQKLSKVPVDPLTGSNYAYSVTNNKKEVQFASILENHESVGFSNIFGGGTAAPGKELGTAYVRGNYNGKFVKVSTGSTVFILGVPSILTSDILSVDLQNIYSGKSFVYDGYNNIPHTYNNTNLTLTGGFNFDTGTNTPVLFEGNEAELATGIGKLTFAENLKNFFIDTILQDNQIYKDIVDLNPLVKPDEAINLINAYISNNVGGLKNQQSINNNYGISNLITFESDSGYSVNSGTGTRITTEKYNGSYSLELTDGIYNGESYKSCITINQKLDYIFSVNLFAKSNNGGYIQVNYLDTNLDEYYLSGFNPTSNWKNYKTNIMEPGTYDFNICYNSDNQNDRLFLDDISFDYTLDGSCSDENDSSFYDINDIAYMCNQGVSTNIIDQGIGQKFTWSCQGTLGGTTQNCSANHIGLPNNIIDFETDTGYSTISGTWNYTNTDKFHGDYSLNSGVDNSCLKVSKTINSISSMEFAVKIAEDSNISSGYIYGQSLIKNNGIQINVYPRETYYSNGWTKYLYEGLNPGNYEIEYCLYKGSGETGSIYFDYVTFDSNGLCGFNSGKNASIFTQGGACKKGNLANFIDNGPGSTYNWDCNSLDGGTSVSCSMNHIIPTTTYPGCDLPDIYLGDTIISSCNVGTNTSGTGVSSYGGFFQWGRNKMFATNDNSQRSTAIPGVTGLDATTDFYDFVWSDTLPWSWSDDDISSNWGGHHGYTWEGSYQAPTVFTNQQGPCADGYHVPDSVEWSKVAYNGGWVSSLDGMSDNGLEMANLLKLPYVGGRSGYDGSLMMVGVHGCYWSSDSPNYNLTIGDDTLVPNSWGKGSNNFDGLSVRCFKN
ncbi:MAG: prepilin-type N-terminal cleavage/methylation domain-containing protein [Candidatus Gracilibacteria bacterium]|nr:prepilin-type N-terminal cleavage/methylation domain-containing protein [Candidatus Gracilibacteria bacterium]